MCGRFTLKVPVDAWIRDLFSEAIRSLIVTSKITEWSPRYNIAPTQPILVLTEDNNGRFEIQPMRWGLVPSWTDSIQSAYSMVNARSETLLEKPTYKHLVETHRCVVLADGYYEWKAPTPKNKIPYWIHADGERPFGMAGLWTTNKKVQSDAPLDSATVITIPANEDTKVVHDRMPAMLMCQDDILAWLAKKDRTPSVLEQELAPPAQGVFQFYEVEKTVNNARNDGPDLVKPVNKLF